MKHWRIHREISNCEKPMKNDVAKQVSKQQNQVLLVLVLPHSHYHDTDFTNNLFQKPFFNYAQMTEALFFYSKCTTFIDLVDDLSPNRIHYVHWFVFVLAKLQRCVCITIFDFATDDLSPLLKIEQCNEESESMDIGFVDNRMRHSHPTTYLVQDGWMVSLLLTKINW